MVRIQIMLKKYNYGQPKTIYPINFKIDFKNEKLELRAVSLDDAKILCNSLSNDGKEKTKIYTSKFLLLHTISHLLIKQLSFECGYRIASLKERIYCSKANEQKKMAGILIYTASGDSAGTLGGLVRQGRSDTFPGLFKKALQTALTCSNDPVCSCSNGQGRDSLNLAACYSCALIPETSCEEFNTFLDRGIVVGTMEAPDEGIYSPQLTLKEDWMCTVTNDYKPEQLVVAEPDFDVQKSSGTDLSDDSYIDIWNYLEEYSEN